MKKVFLTIILGFYQKLMKASTIGVAGSERYGKEST